MKVFAQNRTAAFDKRAVIKCAAAVALLVAASKVSFAIGPVPLTMQTFAVAVVGAWLGPIKAAGPQSGVAKTGRPAKPRAKYAITAATP